NRVGGGELQGSGDMTDLPDDEAQPGSRAWMEQTAQFDSAMATRAWMEQTAQFDSAMATRAPLSERAQRPGSPGLQRDSGGAGVRPRRLDGQGVHGAGRPGSGLRHVLDQLGVLDGGSLQEYLDRSTMQQ